MYVKGNTQVSLYTSVQQTLWSWITADTSASVNTVNCIVYRSLENQGQNINKNKLTNEKLRGLIIKLSVFWVNFKCGWHQITSCQCLLELVGKTFAVVKLSVQVMLFRFVFRKKGWCAVGRDVGFDIWQHGQPKETDRQQPSHFVSPRQPTDFPMLQSLLPSKQRSDSYWWSRPHKHMWFQRDC